MTAASLKKHLKWFGGIMLVVGLLLLGILLSPMLFAWEVTQLFGLLMIGYPLYLGWVSLAYRKKIDQGLPLSPVPFQIYFWFGVTTRLLSLLNGDISGLAIKVAMLVWVYRIIKHIKTYNDRLTLE